MPMESVLGRLLHYILRVIREQFPLSQLPTTGHLNVFAFTWSHDQ